MSRLLLALLVATSAVAADRPPNVVILYADDLGYTDLGSTGATGWKTPHLDKMAADGVRFTSFYTAQPVCSASRAGLLTGCYPNRLGIHGALGPNARHGISDGELTLAEMLKAKGYATAAVGKWHLGHHPQFLPTRHGFDEWLGLPYSNDMWPHHPSAKAGTYPPLPLMDGERAIDPSVTAATMNTLTRRYTDRSVDFIGRNKDRPFLLYLAHTMPHVPLAASDSFRGASGSFYGDVIQEIDASTGMVLAALDKHGLRENTLVLFTSDNGPWLGYGDHAGSAKPLREGKGTVFEGGVRVPAVACWPGKISAGVVQRQPVMTIDVLPTVANLVGGELPAHGVDGKDVWPLFAGTPGATSPHPAYFFYYRTNELQAVRAGKWKLMLPHTSPQMLEGRPAGSGGRPAGYRSVKVPQALYDLDADAGETIDVSAKHPEVVKELLTHAERARGDLGDTLTNRPGQGRREPGRLADPKPGLVQERIFPLHPQHNHAPGIVELPNGELLASWYRGSGERTADDVAVFGSRKPVGGTWSEPFVMADTPGFPDGNTALFLDPAGKLWLFWPLVLANTWESCLTQFRTSDQPAGPGSPKWDWQGQLALKPVDFELILSREYETWVKRLPGPPPAALAVEGVKAKAKDKLFARLGWQTRCKPIVLKSGRWLLPLYTDTFSVSLVAVTDDAGKTWRASQPLAGFGNIQPTLFEKLDGTVVAYMRENGPLGKVRVCESSDGGMTWGSVGESSLVNPGSGIDGVKLADGRWLLVHNDTPKGRHRLAVSLSDDEGKTWKWTRHLADDPAGRFHYPACTQGKDGRVHVVYSTFLPGGKTMTHASFSVSWLTEESKK